MPDRDDRRFATADHPAPTREGRVARGRPVSRRALRGPRTLEAYLRAGNPPRYMQRLREIEDAYRVHRRRLEAAYRAVEAACGHDPELFSARWRARVRAWPFDGLNELIREHNAWYPIEAGLPMDPRSRDYVPVHGASYRRIELGPEWVLEHFPATPLGEGARPVLPSRPPREPA